MHDPYTITVVASTDAEALDLGGMLDECRFIVRCQATVDPALLELADPAVDACVLCVPRGLHPLKELAAQAAGAETRLILYVLHPEQMDARLWAFRQGASDVLMRPFSPAELMFRLERMLAQSPARLKSMGDDAMLEFLQRVVAAEMDTLEPALDPLKPNGHSYPAASRLLDAPGGEGEFLENLADQGMLTRQVVNRTRACQFCGSIHLNYRETCASCGGVNLTSQEMVHHFACAHIAPIDRFRKGAALECPKCHGILRHIGLDYEKPVNHLHCLDCEGVFVSARVEAQCLQCGHVSLPTQTLERLVFRYHLTPLAHEAVREGRIEGVSLESILRSGQTGLHSRQFFTHELQRDLVRHQRYRVPFTVLGVRLEGWQNVLDSHAGQAHVYANSVYKALSHRLRVLDTICVWDEDLLAILLPNTGEEGGQVVANRMHANVQELEFVYSIARPSISVSLVSHAEELKTPEETMAAVLRDFHL